MTSVIIEWSPDAVQALRESRRMTREQFARHLGVVYATIRHWERGIFRPTPDSQKMLDTVLARSSNDQRERFWGMLNDRPTVAGRIPVAVDMADRSGAT